MCHKCNKEIDIDGNPGRADTCPFCSSDLKCCLNCKFFEPGAYNQCIETQSERVITKDRANFCDYFQPVQFSTKTIPSPAKKKNPLDSLFKKKT